ncbi:hypothetical protein DASC09_035750 [Saccharomycopsis crataegensis]|uniref:Uncharacterized protein n=1 Tax=Saccharomycopsis crataegensis TaxID=43959 RepID=A0AAV5QMR6_9ASCO|nr:hypothetical protein DASC09_035750 [Saccharomycopsis crataegensis]
MAHGIAFERCDLPFDYKASPTATAPKLREFFVWLPRTALSNDFVNICVSDRGKRKGFNQ